MAPIEYSRLIVAARTQQGLSQSAAAKKWEIPLATLQAWEQGKNEPGAKHMEKLLPMLMAPLPKKRRR